jgi:hypothetical protein
MLAAIHEAHWHPCQDDQEQDYSADPRKDCM